MPHTHLETHTRIRARTRIHHIRAHTHVHRCVHSTGVAVPRSESDSRAYTRIHIPTHCTHLLISCTQPPQRCDTYIVATSILGDTHIFVHISWYTDLAPRYLLAYIHIECILLLQNVFSYINAQILHPASLGVAVLHTVPEKRMFWYRLFST